MRQAGDIFLNGKQVGLYENGVTAYGIDITDALRPTARRTSSPSRWTTPATTASAPSAPPTPKTPTARPASATGFEWNANDFNPNHGGINRSRLAACHRPHPPDPAALLRPGEPGRLRPRRQLQHRQEDRRRHRRRRGAQHLRRPRNGRPLRRHRRQQRPRPRPVRGRPRGHGGRREVRPLRLRPARQTRASGASKTPTSTMSTPSSRSDGKVVDVNRIETGFRKAEFKGGAGTGGVYINEKFVYLKGFSQRSADEWAGVGAGYPVWMHDYTAKLIRDCHGNYMRWMHISPQKVDADSFTRYGIVQVCPAGDKERDVTGRQWDQRVEVMRDSIDLLPQQPRHLLLGGGQHRRHPRPDAADGRSAQAVGPRRRTRHGHPRRLQQRRQHRHHPHRRVLRRHDGPGHRRGEPDRPHRHVPRLLRRAPRPRPHHRDRGLPQRRLPPHVGRLLAALLQGQEGPQRHLEARRLPLQLGGLRPRRHQAVLVLLDQPHLQPDPAHSRWSAYCSIYFTDEDADGRQDSTEVCRVSGKVDAMRLPKEIYFAHRVIQNDQPDLHILGHWTYPATQPDGSKTVKTVYVIANTESVEFFVNGKSARRQLQARQRLGLRLPRRRLRPRQHQGHRQERRQNRRPAGDRHRRPARRHQAHSHPRPQGPPGRWRRHRPHRLRGRRRQGRPLPHRRRARRLHLHRPRHLARRLQQRQARIHQQPLPQHRVRHQPRRRALHAHPRHRSRTRPHHRHRLARWPQVGANRDHAHSRRHHRRHRRLHARAPQGPRGKLTPPQRDSPTGPGPQAWAGAVYYL